MRHVTLIFVSLLLVAACADQPVSPIVQANAPSAQIGQSPIVHRVSVGGPDQCAKPGCDGNFSLIAIEREDGSVTGQWTDQYGSADGLHAVVDCLKIQEIPERIPVALEAWVGGVVTRPTYQAGQRIITRMRDNGKSANDLPDAIGRGIVDPENPNPNDPEDRWHSANCQDHPAPGLTYIYDDAGNVVDSTGWTDMGFGRPRGGQVTIW